MNAPTTVRLHASGGHHTGAAHDWLMSDGAIKAMTNDEALRSTVAYQAGQAAKRQGLKLEATPLRSLRVGSKQYEQFIAGFDGR
jgi:hypothetical protein